MTVCDEKKTSILFYNVILPQWKWKYFQRIANERFDNFSNLRTIQLPPVGFDRKKCKFFYLLLNISLLRRSNTVLDRTSNRTSVSKNRKGKGILLEDNVLIPNQTKNRQQRDYQTKIGGFPTFARTMSKVDCAYN